MNQRDTPIGVVLLLLAGLVLWHVSSYPPAPGQPYNAALFPGIAATGLGIAAIMLIAQGLRQSRQARKAAPNGESEAARTIAPVPSRLLAILLTAGAVIFYLLLADRLGFVPTGILMLAVLMWAYGVRLAVLVPVSIIATLVIHTSFYKLLKVPLPWGILQPVAW